MKRTFATILAVAAAFLNAPGLHAAPLRTELAFAFTENARAGARFWCGFPDSPGHWVVVLYEKQLDPPAWWHGNRYTYTPLVAVFKPAGASADDLVYQSMTVPPHSSQKCVLVAYRNGIQQPYWGWTAYNPFGWHSFGGVSLPTKARVAEFPPGTRAADIRNYQTLMRSQWNFPLLH